MKRNAIARIIIWSLVILVLLGLLVGVITYQSYRSTAWHSFYRIPDGSNSSGGTPLSAASLVEVDDKVEVPADSVREIEIDWASGNITVMTYDSTDTITFYEEGCTDTADAMVWKQKSGELEIRFCAENRYSFFSIGKSFSKDLTILIPKGWECEKLDLDTASTKLYLSDLTVRKVDLDCASGDCRMENCTVDAMDIDSASGDVYFTGSLNRLDCDAASASVYAELTNVPSRIEMDSMSGDLELTLPDDAGFTLTMDGLSNRFTSDFSTTSKNGRMVCGDGFCQIDMDGMSGSVTIRKASATAASNSFTFPAAPTVPEAPTAPEAPAAPETPTAPTAPTSVFQFGTAHQHTDACRTNPSSCPDSDQYHHPDEHH